MVMEDVEVEDPKTGEIVLETRRRPEIIENFRIKDGRIGIHHGRLGKLRKLLPDVRWVDARADVPMVHDVRMVNSPRYNQAACFEDFRESDGAGHVRAPTAWGKTFFGIYAAVMLNQRTLVLCSRTNWLENWLKDVREHTNLCELEEAAGRPLAGLIRGDLHEDDLFPCFNVATPQSFMSKRGRAVRRRLRHSFGLVIFDEAVELPAEKTAAVFTSFAPLWRLALSADEIRKDRKHRLAYDYAGPVVATGIIQSSERSATISVIDTGVQINSNYLYGRHWFGSLCTQLSRRRARNTRIVEEVIKDVLDGFKVLVLVDRRAHAMVLKSMLEDEVIPVIQRNRKTKKRRRRRRTLKVEVLMGGDKLQMEKIAAAGRGEFDVFVAMDRAVGKNTDMPRIDCVHDVAPINNVPVIRQRVGRGLRPCYGCEDCGYQVASAKHQTCPECGSSRFGNIKKWPIRVKVYKDEATPVTHRAAKFLESGMATRLQHYREQGFDIEGDEVTRVVSAKRRRKPRAGSRERSSFIRRKGDRR